MNQNRDKDIPHACRCEVCGRAFDDELANEKRWRACAEKLAAMIRKYNLDAEVETAPTGVREALAEFERINRETKSPTIHS